MTITTTQKIIKIGTSRGVTLPAKELKALGASEGDDVEITVRLKHPAARTDDVLARANDLLARYDKDFTNLADR